MAEPNGPMANVAAEIVAGMSETVRAEVERKCAEAIAGAASYGVEVAVRQAVSDEIERVVAPQVTLVVSNAAPQIVAAVEAAIPEVAKTIAEALVAKVKKNAASYRMDHLVKEMLS